MNSSEGQIIQITYLLRSSMFFRIELLLYFKVVWKDMYTCILAKWAGSLITLYFFRKIMENLIWEFPQYSSSYSRGLQIFGFICQKPIHSMELCSISPQFLLVEILSKFFNWQLNYFNHFIFFFKPSSIRDFLIICNFWNIYKGCVSFSKCWS